MSVKFDYEEAIKILQRHQTEAAINVWYKPNIEQVKINSDAAVKVGRGMGHGVVIRDSNGSILAAEALYFAAIQTP